MRVIQHDRLVDVAVCIISVYKGLILDTLMRVHQKYANCGML